MRFFILMVDYGRSGREAVVNPEHNRADIIAQARDLLASRDRDIAFVKLVDGDSIEDVTAGIVTEAAAGLAAAEPVDRMALAFDHARDLRKHAEP
jgi:hypothetical protein